MLDKIQAVSGKVVFQEIPVVVAAGKIQRISNDANPTIKGRVVSIADGVTNVKVGDFIVTKLYSTIDITGFIYPDSVVNERIMAINSLEIIAIIPNE